MWRRKDAPRITKQVLTPHYALDRPPMIMADDSMRTMKSNLIFWTPSLSIQEKINPDRTYRMKCLSNCLVWTWYIFIFVLKDSWPNWSFYSFFEHDYFFSETASSHKITKNASVIPPWWCHCLFLVNFIFILVGESFRCILYRCCIETYLHRNLQTCWM